MNSNADSNAAAVATTAATSVVTVKKDDDQVKDQVVVRNNDVAIKQEPEHESAAITKDETSTKDGDDFIMTAAAAAIATTKKLKIEQEEKIDQTVSPSSKASSLSRSQKRRRSHSRSHSASHESRGRSHHRSRKTHHHHKRPRSTSAGSTFGSRSRSRSTDFSVTSAGGYSTSSSHYSREQRRKDRKSKRKKDKHKSKRSGDKDDTQMFFSKDQRTVFVSQLVMRTTERDLKKYFKRTVGCKVNDVILLRDRRQARNHKGCAYVEVGRIEDVAKAVGVSNQPPDFQRFPILVKASEAEKNYVHSSASNNNSAGAVGTAVGGPATATGTTEGISLTNGTTGAVVPNAEKLAASAATIASTFLPPLRDETGRLIESQKVYVGGLDPSVGEEHLYALFSQFGTLHKVHIQTDAATRMSKGFAFLSFRDPKVSHLAIRTMAGQLMAGQPLKTGWASQNQQSMASIASGCTVVTSDQYPIDAATLAQKALAVLAQMTGGGSSATSTPTSVPTVTGSMVAAAAAAAVTSSASSTDPSALATMAEQELDKAMGFATTVTTTTTATTANPGIATASAMPTVAEARASMAADVVARQLAAATAAKSRFIGNLDGGLTRHLLIHNMYDKDEETEAGWEHEIKEEFLEECSKFGTIEHAKVLHTESGGKIYATFGDAQAAKNCADNLAGRWFDKRQLRVDFMPEATPP